MDLLQHIKSERAQKKRKQPFSCTLFDKVSGLVKKYGLDKRFLEKLDGSPDLSLQETLAIAGVRIKEAYEPQLFSLVTAEQYSLAREIIARAENPYLQYVTSPAEILLCGALFTLNPSLEPSQLERYDFETLLLCEHAKKYVKQLVQDVTDLKKQMGDSVKAEVSAEKQSHLDSLGKQIQRLQSFIAKVDNTESQPR